LSGCLFIPTPSPSHRCRCRPTRMGRAATPGAGRTQSRARCLSPSDSRRPAHPLGLRVRVDRWTLLSLYPGWPQAQTAAALGPIANQCTLPPPYLTPGGRRAAGAGPTRPSRPTAQRSCRPTGVALRRLDGHLPAAARDAQELASVRYSGRPLGRPRRSAARSRNAGRGRRPDPRRYAVAPPVVQRRRQVGVVADELGRQQLFCRVKVVGVPGLDPAADDGLRICGHSRVRTSAEDPRAARLTPGLAVRR
jgi:hypothetical protein